MPDITVSNLAPAYHAVKATPDDEEMIPQTRGIYVGTAGNLAVEMASGEHITFINLAAGIIHPIQVRRVYATGTDADDVIAIY
jgi:hypothetical protein